MIHSMNHGYIGSLWQSQMSQKVQVTTHHLVASINPNNIYISHNGVQNISKNFPNFQMRDLLYKQTLA